MRCEGCFDALLHAGDEKEPYVELQEKDALISDHISANFHPKDLFYQFLMKNLFSFKMICRR